MKVFYMVLQLHCSIWGSAIVHNLKTDNAILRDIQQYKTESSAWSIKHNSINHYDQNMNNNFKSPLTIWSHAKYNQPN